MLLLVTSQVLRPVLLGIIQLLFHLFTYPGLVIQGRIDAGNGLFDLFRVDLFKS